MHFCALVFNKMKREARSEKQKLAKLHTDGSKMVLIRGAEAEGSLACVQQLLEGSQASPGLPEKKVNRSPKNALIKNKWV